MRVYEHLHRVTILYGFQIKLLLINKRSKTLYPYNAIELSILHFVTLAINLQYNRNLYRLSTLLHFMQGIPYNGNLNFVYFQTLKYAYGIFVSF